MRHDSVYRIQCQVRPLTEFYTCVQSSNLIIIFNANIRGVAKVPGSLIIGGVELIIIFTIDEGDVTLAPDSLSEEGVELVPVSLS